MAQFRTPGCTCFIAGDDLDFGTLARQRAWAPRAPDHLPGLRTATDTDPSAPAISSAATAAVTVTDELDPDIEVLALGTAARKAAYVLKKAHPHVKFTSGRRDKAAQARAMASNIVKNRKWIEATYARSTVRARCQTWVDGHPEATTQAEIAAGLLTVLNDSTDAQLSLFSKHLSGDAFDVQPVDAQAEAIKATIRSLRGLDRFLDMEGGLVRWHAQF